MNDYSIERFKQHLVNALPLIDGECLADEEPTLNHLFGDSPTSSLTIRSK